MSETITESLTETEDSTINITTTADVIKPFFRYPKYHVQELKLHADSDGLRFKVVDPANVVMCVSEIPAEAFETFDVEETTVGLNISDVLTALRAGRMRQEDTVTLSLSGDRLNTQVQREYDGVEMDLTNTVRIIDPDSIRQEPDIPELDLPATVNLPVSAFEATIDAVDSVSKHIQFTTDGNNLVAEKLKNSGETAQVTMHDVVDSPEDVTSMFSLDYLTDTVTALKKAKADDLSFRLGDEFPIFIDWTREVNGVEITGEYMQAPRIQSD